MLRVYLQRTTGYSRAQVTRLVTQWHDNRLAAVPLKKRYRAPVVPFARKYSRRCMPDVEGPLSKSLKVAFGYRSDCPLYRFIAGKQSVRFRFLKAASRH